MSIEKITDSILSEADLEAKGIIEEAKKSAEEIIRLAKEKQQTILNEANTSASFEKDRILTGKRAVINVDTRKIILEKKQEVLKETFEKAGVDFEEHKRELQGDVAKILF